MPAPSEKKVSFYILFSLWLVVFAASSQIMIISPILPRIGEQLGTSPALLGYLVTGYAVMLGIFALITGPISDRIGRRRILLFGTAGMGLSLMLHQFVFDFWSFLLLRSLSGVAGGVLSGAAVAYIGDYFPYEKRGWANGWVMSGIAMGQILGIPIGTLLAEHLGFKMPFVLFGVFMLMAWSVIYLKVPQPNVVLRENRMSLADAAKGYLKLLSQADIRAVAACYALMFLSISTFIVYLPTWLESTFHVSGNAIAGLFFVGGIANVLSGPNAGKLSDKIGRKTLIIISCMGLSVIIIGITFTLTSFWMAYPLFFLVMMLIAMRISPFQALSSELVNANNRGTLMSMLVAIGQVGNGLGSAIAGPFYQFEGYVSNTILSAFTLLLMAYIVWRWVPEPELLPEITA